MKEIVQEVSKYYGLWGEQIYIRSRKRAIVKPRQIAIYLVKKYTIYSLNQIGLIFKFNHATVIHAVKSVENQIQTDKKFRQEIDDLIAIINQNHSRLFKSKPIPFKQNFFCNPVRYDLQLKK